VAPPPSEKELPTDLGKKFSYASKSRVEKRGAQTGKSQAEMDLDSAFEDLFISGKTDDMDFDELFSSYDKEAQKTSLDSDEQREARRKRFLDKRKELLDHVKKKQQEQAQEEATSIGYRGYMESPLASSSNKVAVPIPHRSPYTEGIDKDLAAHIKDLSQQRTSREFNQVYSMKDFEDDEIRTKSRSIAHSGSSDSIEKRRFYIIMTIVILWVIGTLSIMNWKGIL